MVINGFFDFKTKENEFINCKCWSKECKDSIAKILCNDKYSNPQKILEYVTKKNAKGKIQEDGLFLAVVFYRKNLYIYADSTSSPWVLYYTISNNKFFYSTSLKELLSISKIEREFNLVSAKGFLKNGIVLGSNTLIKNVSKLDAGEIIVIKNNNIKKRKLRYKSLNKGTKPANLIQTLRTSVGKFTQDNSQVFMPLSGGFDSNLILDTLVRKDCTIEAFTVGGYLGKNEIPVVAQNIKNYKKINHHTAIVDNSVFKKLPEIIWRLDGYVYERGIFLQYILAKLVLENKGQTLICGECSDEHQHLLYKNERAYLKRNYASPLENMNWMLRPFSQGNFVVMKKSSLMLNSFGIRAEYPFATKKFTDIAQIYGKKNLDNKQFYISLLKNELPKPFFDALIHAGGATSIETVLSDSDLKKIKKIVSTNSLIERIKIETPDCYEPLILDVYESYLEEKGRINIRVAKAYIKYLVKRILKKLNRYSEKITPIEDTIDTEIKEFYLIIFSELFLSNNFNSYLANPDFSLFDNKNFMSEEI